MNSQRPEPIDRLVGARVALGFGAAFRVGEVTSAGLAGTADSCDGGATFTGETTSPVSANTEKVIAHDAMMESGRIFRIRMRR